jgi:cytochrome o ubiquinol oxidase subunit 1
MMAALTFWFPKAFGFTLNEFWGKVSFWCWLVGYWLAFTPLYILGFKGMPRRLNHFEGHPDWAPYLFVAEIGACFVGLGILSTLIQFAVSIRDRKKNADLTGDPWNARSLEWSTASPAPFYNFARIPQITSLEQHWEDKELGRANVLPATFEDIHMPMNTSAGVFISGFGFVLCFALIWHMWLVAVVGLVGAIASFIVRTYNRDVDYWVPAATVARMEAERHALAKKAA